MKEKTRLNSCGFSWAYLQHNDAFGVKTPVMGLCLPCLVQTFGLFSWVWTKVTCKYWHWTNCDQNFDQKRGSGSLGFWTNCINKAVFSHDFWVKSNQLATEFTRSLPFIHAQHSGRFSAQTCYSGERWSSRVQLTETGRDVLTLLPGSRQHVYSTRTPSAALFTTNSLDIFVCVFYECVTHRYLFSFFFFQFSCSVIM